MQSRKNMSERDIINFIDTFIEDYKSEPGMTDVERAMQGMQDYLEQVSEIPFLDIVRDTEEQGRVSGLRALTEIGAAYVLIRCQTRTQGEMN